MENTVKDERVHEASISINRFRWKKRGDNSKIQMYKRKKNSNRYWKLNTGKR